MAETVLFLTHDPGAVKMVGIGKKSRKNAPFTACTAVSRPERRARQEKPRRDPGMPDLETTSKFISLILRHKPEAAGIALDEHGWADVRKLIAGVNRTRPLTMEQLETIVRTDSKQRYSFNADHTLIRANQGHSIPVDVELKKTAPPAVLYHGTGAKYVPSVKKEGLLPQSRLYVHLSSDVPTALNVGRRHGKPVVFRIDAGKMAEDGYDFFLSVNGVWLTKHVPVRYMTEEETV